MARLPPGPGRPCPVPTWGEEMASSDIPDTPSRSPGLPPSQPEGKGPDPGTASLGECQKPPTLPGCSKKTKRNGLSTAP